jgi:hypothetical protein
MRWCGGYRGPVPRPPWAHREHTRPVQLAYPDVLWRGPDWWKSTVPSDISFYTAAGQGGLEPPTSGFGDQDLDRFFGLNTPKRVAVGKSLGKSAEN